MKILIKIFFSILLIFTFSNTNAWYVTQWPWCMTTIVAGYWDTQTYYTRPNTTPSDCISYYQWYPVYDQNGVGYVDDWIHNSLWEPLYQLWIQYISWQISIQQLDANVNAAVRSRTNWEVAGSVFIDLAWNLHIWCANNPSIVTFYGSWNESYNIDTTPPTWNATYSTTLPTNWNVIVYTNCVDEIGWTWCSQTNNTKIVTANESGFIDIYDNAWNKGIVSYEVNNIDTTPPTWNATYSTTLPTNWNVIVYTNCVDTGWSWCSETNNTKTVTSNESWAIRIYDNAWNYYDVPYEVTNIDKELPLAPLDTTPPTWIATYSTTLPTTWSVIIYTNCVDNIWWTWCRQTNNTKTVTANESWTIRIYDNAWNHYDVPYEVSNIYTPTTVIITYEGINSWCSSYINHWEEIWWGCAINWNWTTAWTINCIQENPWTPIQYACWLDKWTPWSSTSCDADWNCIESSWTTYSCDTSNCPWNAPRPETTYANTTVTATLNAPISDCDSVYANDSTTCWFYINITGSPLQSKAITWISWLSITNITDKSNQASNRVDWVYNKDTNNALNFSGVNNTSITWSDKNYRFDISWVKARAPFETSVWKVSVDLQWISAYTTVNISNISYNFLKPFTWILDSSLDGTNWGKNPILWTIMNYKLYLNAMSTLSKSILFDYKLTIFQSNIEKKWINLELQDVNIDNTSFNKINSWSLFFARINTSSDILTSLPVPWLQIKSSIIEYLLWWSNVKYILSNDTAPNDDTPIVIDGTTFLWVKVIWNLQWAWKQTITWQKNNFSDISKIETKTDIRKNAFILTKLMTSWRTVNKVKYVEWIDETITGDQDYETLIVKNGNVIITGNLNTSKKKLWIIVLKDNYNISDGYNWKWNVYINNWVTYINAAIYTDWWLISSNGSGTPYITDSSNRTNSLQKQLTFKWSLFSKNTIWGAILSGWKYILPWWSKSLDFDKAMIYDLNYIRRWNDWCDKSSPLDWDCTDSWEYKDPFIIIYNSDIQNNPPKWFGK